MSNQTSFVESTFKKLSKTNNNIDDCSTLLPESESTFKKLSETNNNIDDDETCFKKILITPSSALTNPFPENDGWNEKKDKEAREAYIMARACGTYDYYRLNRDFPEDEEEQLVKCPTCEEMIYSDEQHGMCIDCFKIEQKLYPDDIPMELRYKN